MGRDRFRILVADEQPLERRRVVRLSEELGWLADEVASADELRGRLGGPPGPEQCVLLSAALAFGPGWEALTACRTARPWLPVVVLAQDEDAETLLSAWRSGAAGYLRRSELATDSLERLVRRVVESSGAPPRNGQDDAGAHPLRMIQATCHDLRNPLSAIMINANILLRAEPLTEERRDKGARRILASAQRMNRMVEDLADYAVVGQGKPISLRPGDVDLLGIASEVMAELRPAHPSRELVLETEGQLRGRWDSGRLRQVLLSLLTCAVKRDRPGTTVVLGCVELAPAPEVEIRIYPRSASGAQDPELRPSEPAAATEAGTDIMDAGIFVARRIVELHHGTLSSPPSPDGPAFRIRLPKRPPPL